MKCGKHLPGHGNMSSLSTESTLLIVLITAVSLLHITLCVSVLCLLSWGITTRALALNGLSILKGACLGLTLGLAVMIVESLFAIFGLLRSVPSLVQP